MRRLSTIGCLVAFIATLGLGKATAQLDQGLSDQELIDPWLRAKAVVLSLAPLLDSPTANDQRGRLDADLSKLADELSKFQTELENVAIRIVSVPEFAYDAATSRPSCPRRCSRSRRASTALFGELKIRERPDVRAMQGSIDSLRQTPVQPGSFRARRRPRDRLRQQERDSSARGAMVEGRGERRGRQARGWRSPYTAGSRARQREERLSCPMVMTLPDECLTDGRLSPADKQRECICRDVLYISITRVAAALRG